jgi:hypothetical protein
MKKSFLSGYFLVFGIFVLFISSCKGKSSQTMTNDTATITTPADNTVKKMPDTTVIISADDSLKSMITDATKDFPGVTATVDQGVITLTGNITRDKLPKLMMAVNALHPKKVNNNLTINK